MADQTQPPELLKSPAVLMPSKEELTKISEDLRLKCSEEEIDAFHEHFRETMKTYQRVNEIPEPQLPVKYPRTPGHRETKDSAWYWRCDIKGADTGKLAGKTVGIKDNVAVAGVPMMNGNKHLEGYTPEFDATVVTRILNAGGRVLGKTTCEDLCLSGNSWTSSSGPVPNPHCPRRSAGGSSSGSASLVARGEIDLAVGGDQGGSIRIPSSWCGVVGHKPTFGLVPYTGAVPIELTVDHLGPIARTVEDCALFLEVLAGYDNGTDPRQHPGIVVPPYSSLLKESVAGKRVGIVTEGFIDVDSGVSNCVREAANRLTEAGIVVEEVSVPLHADGLDIWTPVCFEGCYNMMIKGNGNGQNWKGQYCLSMQEALTRGYNLRPHDFSMPCKLLSVFSEYMARNYQNKFYAKAQNLTRLLTQAYDQALRSYDVLIMPTLPSTAMALPTTDMSLSEIIHLTFAMIKNTAPFDSTGHPALTINAGQVDGLPGSSVQLDRMAREKESPLHHLENCADEISLNVLLTNHLFAMLCSSSQFTMDNYLYRNHDRYTCPCGNDQCELTGKCGDTSIGNTKVWHGNLDVILNSNLPVKFTSLGDGDYNNADDETKNMSQVDNCVNLNRTAGLKLNQQMIAEVIVSSFLNKKLHPCSDSYLVPCLGSCGTDLVVYLYDAQHDVLLESCQFELRNKTTGALNLVTIIVTWLVVNYRYTCTGLTPYMMKKSNFFTSAKEKLQVYQEDLKFGCVSLSEAEAVVEVSDLPWNLDGLKDIDDELDKLSKHF